MNKFDEFNELDNPLVVHNKNDVQLDDENTNNLELNQTHTKNENDVLERHRFKKENKGNKKGSVVVTIVLLVAIVIGLLYFTGIIGSKNENQENVVVETTTERVTTIEEKYDGTIVVKDMYIFVNGREVDGINGLQKELKYVDPSPTKFTIIQENINNEFYNNEILPILESLGFYDHSTKVTMVHSTGLMAQAETTVATTTEVATESSVTNVDNLDGISE